MRSPQRRGSPRTPLLASEVSASGKSDNEAKVDDVVANDEGKFL